MSERTKNVLFAIFVVIMIGALAWLGVSERMRNRQIAEKNRQLSESLAEEDSQKQGAGAKVYNELAQTIDAAGVGLVCIGDSEMAGNLQDSLPHELNDLTNETLFAKIIDDLASKTKVYDTRDLEIEVANRGTKDEDLNAIMARCGAHRMLVEKDFTMPEGGDYVVVEMKDEAGNELHFAKQEHVKFGIVTIDGIEGRFYSANESYDETHKKEAFRRDNAGKGTEVTAGTVVESEGATQYRSYYPVMFFGEQQGVDADDFVDCMKDIVAAYGKGGAGKGTDGDGAGGDGSGDGSSADDEDEDGGSESGDKASDSGSGDDDGAGSSDGDSDSGDGEHYAVICTTAAGSDYDKALQAAFGDRYFRNDKRSNDMTRSDYEDLAARIYESFDKQGSFNRIKKAVEAAEGKL